MIKGKWYIESDIYYISSQRGQQATIPGGIDRGRKHADVRNCAICSVVKIQRK